MRANLNIGFKITLYDVFMTISLLLRKLVSVLNVLVSCYDLGLSQMYLLFYWIISIVNLIFCACNITFVSGSMLNEMVSLA